MQNRKEENHWFIILAIIIIILVVVALSSANDSKITEREAEEKRRKEEEQKLEKELEDLESKLNIYVRHKSIHAFTEKYMNELCEKRFKQLVQILIAILIILNVLTIWLVPSMKVLDLFSWNAIGVVLLNLLAIFFFASVKKGKDYLKGIALNYIEFRVYENRDKNYFNQKVKFYNTEIEKLRTEIETKRDLLGNLKDDGTKSIDQFND